MLQCFCLDNITHGCFNVAHGCSSKGAPITSTLQVDSRCHRAQAPESIAAPSWLHAEVVHI
jgi:hypothetical protein